MIHECMSHKKQHGSHPQDCIVFSNPLPYIHYECVVGFHWLYLLVYQCPKQHVQIMATLMVNVKATAAAAAAAVVARTADPTDGLVI